MLNSCTYIVPAIRYIITSLILINYSYVCVVCRCILTYLNLNLDLYIPSVQIHHAPIPQRPRKKPKRMLRLRIWKMQTQIWNNL